MYFSYPCESRFHTPYPYILPYLSFFPKNKIFLLHSNSIINQAKAFDYVDHNKLWNIQQMGLQDHLTCLLRNLYASQELDMEQQIGSKSGKEYIRLYFVTLLI